ncbi:MAG: response regulator [Candidatus Paceibacterota bacterium]
MSETNQKILIVDDDKFLVDMYSIKFTESDYEVATAFSAKDALRLADEGLAPDICLVDIIMPSMDGFELVAELKTRELFKNTIIIFLTNLGQQSDIDRGLELGADGYIVKASATPSEVVVKVADIVKHK